MYKLFILIIVLFISQISNSQDNFTSTYPDSLKENAQAILRENRIEIDIISINKMNIKKKRIITVFNELGLKHVDAFEYYDKATSIKKIEATIYNSAGTELKKIKRRDFKDHSVTESSIITDNRVLYIEYTPIQYPITIVFESEINTSNTAFIPSWYGVENYNLGIQKSSINIKYSPEVQFKYKEINIGNSVEKIISGNSINFSIQNVKPLKQEDLSPSQVSFFPHVMFGLNKFNLEGLIGTTEDWDSFGSWVYEYLLKDTEEIPLETVQKLKTLIGEEKDFLKIAKTVYEFVQNKTRYVSVQLGIGGWKPMLAKDVDRLGYGDCKALTNYTRSLLKAFDVPSYYTIVYGDKTKRDLVEDFVAMQGNHVILGIPYNNEITWLECTSQVQPFGFQGDFTDDRKVLIINSEKSEIVKTTAYNGADNNQKTNATVELLNNGDMVFDFKMISKGIIYDNKFHLELKSKEELTKYYKENINNINNKEFTSININHTKENLELEEKIYFTAKEFAKINNQRIMMPINLANPIVYIPSKYKVRNNPFQINRGYFYEDEIILKIPTHYFIESIPANSVINSVYGDYICTISHEGNTITFKRSILLKEGTYNSNQYDDYRKFREQIAKNENLKIVLNTK